MRLAAGSRIAIARMGHLGDVLSCLPIAAVIKRERPDVEVYFVASRYAEPLLEACGCVDGIIDAQAAIRDPTLLRDASLSAFINPMSQPELARAARQAAIPLRIGNLKRLKMLAFSNRFVWSSRKWTSRHEAQINLKHLKPLGFKSGLKVSELSEFSVISRAAIVSERLQVFLGDQAYRVIIHPKSNKNGREWPLARYLELVRLLQGTPFQFYLTGTARERGEVVAECPELLESGNVVDLMGSMNLTEFVAFIAAADGFISGSTGPLHIAAAAGIRTLGLFPPRSGLNAQRWRPLGPEAEVLQKPGDCKPGKGTCARHTLSQECPCMQAISARLVSERVNAWLDEDQPRLVRAQAVAQAGRVRR